MLFLALFLLPVYVSVLANRIGVRFLDTQIINYPNNVKAFKCMNKFKMQFAPMMENDNSYWSQWSRQEDSVIHQAPWVSFCPGCMCKMASSASVTAPPPRPRQPIRSEPDNELHNNKIPSNRLSVSTTVAVGTIRKERWKEESTSKEWKRDQKGTNSRSRMRQPTFQRFSPTPFTTKMENS